MPEKGDARIVTVLSSGSRYSLISNAARLFVVVVAAVVDE